MNRIIKFRGFSLTDNIWVFGSLNIYIDGRTLITNIEGSQSWFVKPESVGQLTGLKDKAGKDIYEGDIVKLIKVDGFFERDSEEIAKVCFYPEMGCFGFQINNDGWLIFSPQNCKRDSIEIIGNLFESPELINQP